MPFFPYEGSQGTDATNQLPRLIWFIGVLLVPPGLWPHQAGSWKCWWGFPSSLSPQGASQLLQDCLPAHVACPWGVLHLTCPEALLKHVCSDVPSQDSVWLSLEQPGWVSLGPPLLISKPRGCFCSEAEQKEVCSQDPLSRSRAAEGDTTLVAMVPLGSGSPGQEIIRDCLFVVPSLSQTV